MWSVCVSTCLSLPKLRPIPKRRWRRRCLPVLRFTLIGGSGLLFTYHLSLVRAVPLGGCGRAAQLRGVAYGFGPRNHAEHGVPIRRLKRPIAAPSMGARDRANLLSYSLISRPGRWRPTVAVGRGLAGSAKRQQPEPSAHRGWHLCRLSRCSTALVSSSGLLLAKGIASSRSAVGMHHACARVAVPRARVSSAQARGGAP